MSGAHRQSSSDENSGDDYDYEVDHEGASTSFDPIGGVRKAVDQLRSKVADRSHEMKETLKPLLGKVFHAVGNTGVLYRYRIGFDGRLTLEKRFQGSFITVDKLRETRGRILEAGKAVPVRAQRRWRAVVTGDPNKRIRDHMKETPQVKMMDKVSFTLGVSVICFAEYLLLRHPELFPIFYYCLMPVLFITRYFDYAAIKSELYMIDFCYFINFSVMLQTALYPDNLEWFQANYVLSLGPICLAIVVWRNSLVFHSLDKLTSFFLHSFPTMVCHIYRWKLVDSKLNFSDEYMGLYGHIVLPLALYATWQFTYLFITEVILRDTLAKDQEIITSLRYLARDEKNSMNQITLAICRKLGYVKPRELLDPDTTIAKVVFVLAQLVYTIITVFHTAFLYTTYHGSCYYIVFVFIQGVWNGASYYIEVFSKRYNLKFDDKPTKAADIEEDQDGDDDNLMEALGNVDLTKDEYNSLIEHLVNDEELSNDDDNSEEEGLNDLGRKETI